ncbi:MULTISPECIES: hypothetical protein [Novosphingobium]|uniref:YtxH domain-containing protein n=1 Tax=Novosphingobium decolorationis TaxID=2698673 RepID=A0ABX8E049_9SPHN|nr:MULTISPECIES: hypothetical protein [Novosphingobium]QVM82500.1 hypothetical protein HT578_01195 [Novosphingobium decolorationis]GAM06923.1 hypothetical conserved protein [Novosphingobium sp. MBES04]
MADSEPTTPATSATSANTGNIVALHSSSKDERPSEKVIGFVKRHPVITVAGGLAVGAAVAALLPRRMTRGAATRAISIAQTAGTTTLLFGKRAGDEIRLLGHRASDETHAALEGLEERAEHAGDYAAGKLEKLATAALGFASSIARKSGKRIEQAGEATSEGTHKLADFAEDLRKKVGH